jgi:hypothetical protein
MKMTDDAARALQTYLEQILSLHHQQTPEQGVLLTQTELKALALQAGLSESDWQRVERTRERYFANGREAFRLQDWDNAIYLLTQAAALCPYEPEVLHSLATAHTQRWQEERRIHDRLSAEHYIGRLQRINPRHRGAARLQAMLNKGHKKPQRHRSQLKIILGVGLIGVLALWIWVMVSIRYTTYRLEKVREAFQQVEMAYLHRESLLTMAQRFQVANDPVQVRLFEELQQTEGLLHTQLAKKILPLAHQTNITAEVQWEELLTQLSVFVASTNGEAAFDELEQEVMMVQRRITLKSRQYNQVSNRYNTHLAYPPQCWLKQFRPQPLFNE